MLFACTQGLRRPMRKKSGFAARIAALRGAALLCGLLPAVSPVFAAPPLVSPVCAAERTPGAMRIYVIDVGQGDSALIIFPDNRTMLIDAGEREAAPYIIALLTRLGIRRLDYAVASHGHPDHAGGFGRLVAEGYIGPSTTAYSWWNRNWKGIQWHRVMVGDVLCDSGGATVTCYAAGAHVVGGVYVRPERNLNARSIVLNIKYKGFDYLSGGDLTGAGKHPDVESHVGDALAARGIHIDVYKVHHHGSRSSSNMHFLKKIMPEFATISVGDDNPYGHPTRTVLKRLNDPSVHVTRIFQTQSGDGATAPNVTVANGQIVVITDGTNYRFTNEGPGSTPFSYGPYPVDECTGSWPMFRGRSS